MMPLLEPGVPTAMFGRLDAQFMLRGRIALTELADVIKKQAKRNASNGRHQLHTPTPARPGHGPAIISKSLVNSIDRSSVTREVFGYYCRIGMVEGNYSPYNGNTTTSKYAQILELIGTKNGNMFPFLYPAAGFGFGLAAEIIFREKYGSRWVKLI
jgi:hypothetical protein